MADTNENKWLFFEKIDFSDKSIKQFHIDTRDFHCLTSKENYDLSPKNVDMENIPNMYILSEQEVRDLITRYFNESGGCKKWRYFSLSGNAKFRTAGWEFKYIRIYRVEKGLVVCGRNDKPNCFMFSKNLLDCKVDQNYLDAY